MCKYLLVALLVFSLSGASPPGARDTERDDETSGGGADRTTAAAAAGAAAGAAAAAGPEVPDMLSGAAVNRTFLHKADSDGDEPGGVVAPVPELSTRRADPEQVTNLTDRVDSPRVLDPGTTHQEDSNNNNNNNNNTNTTSAVSKAANATRDAPANASQTTPTPAEVSAASPEARPTAANATAQASGGAPGSGTTTAPPASARTAEESAATTRITSTTTTNQAPAKNEEEPAMPPQVEVPGNESQALLAGAEPHTSQQRLSAAGDPGFLQPSQSAAILAGVFVAVALLGYVGLLVWRRLLEKKYGNREMLVNEDEFYDTSDLRHFEL